MATKKLPTGILFIDGNRIDVYNALKNIVVSLDFPQEVIRYSEVLDREKLHALIKSLIETNKISPSSLTVVLAKTGNGLIAEAVYSLGMKDILYAGTILVMFMLLVSLKELCLMIISITMHIFKMIPYSL